MGAPGREILKCAGCLRNLGFSYPEIAARTGYKKSTVWAALSGKTKEQNRRYYEKKKKDPEWVAKRKASKRKYARERYAKDREKILKQGFEYYRKNRERILKQGFEYYRKNRERILKRARERSLLNPEVIRLKRAAYYQANKARLIKKIKDYASRNPDKTKSIQSKVRLKQITRRSALRNLRLLAAAAEILKLNQTNEHNTINTQPG